VRTARSAELVAKGAYLPSVAVNALAGRSDQSVTGNTVLPTAQPGSPQSAYGAGVSASLDLFTGGRRSAVRHETSALSRAADAGLIAQRFLTRLEAQQGYLEVLRGHELVRVADEGVAVAQRSLSFAKARAEAGTATPSDVLRAELGLSQARRQWLAARDTLASGAAALGRLVGADGPVDAEPLATLNPIGLALDDSAIVRTAVHDAPSVQQAQALLTAAHASVRAAKSQYAPTIQAGGGYNWSNDGRVPGALNQGWVIQVGTSFPLFNGFIREDAVTQADVAAEVASSSSADTRRFSRAEALRLLGSLHVAEQDVTLATDAVQLAQEDLRVISVRYRAGIATILDQLTSQQNLIQAELDLVSARFTYQVTLASLEALLGRELRAEP
jgi:outer membrane protein